MEWAVEVEDMTVAYTTKPVLWDVDMKVWHSCHPSCDMLGCNERRY